MSAIRFRTMEKGNLPHLSYIFRKTESLGTEFKTVACSVTEVLIFIEVQRLKKVTKHRMYQQQIEATEACTKRTTEATNVTG